AWAKMVRSLDTGEIFNCVVKQQVKGGLRAETDGVSVFIPASHLRLGGVPSDLSQYVGQKLPVKVLEIDRARKSVVASHKLVLEEVQERKAEEVWSKIEPGQTLTGIVRRITDFGVFVDIGGIDGLIHIGDLTWYHVDKASDIVGVGNTVQVVVLSADRERNRISLGMKQLTPKPWDNILDKYHEGDVVTGKVVRIANFGAFVQLEPGVDGLVHISQLSENRVGKVEDVVHVGDVLDFVVLDVKPAEKKISLSLKDAKAKEEYGEEGSPADEPAAESSDNVEDAGNSEEVTE
ncbi:MAG TPA: S1 RNA-binding domain-containing protein, partial [Clostridia bacterium]|nr:S1 RNA-binding domain-containing protein [Clostridia bacterium]